MMPLTGQVLALLERAERHAVNEAGVEQLQTVASRMNDPLRVALIGRAKAGKSTLLNALVGDLVAPTDAAECTLIPTEYHDGLTYRAWKVTNDGEIHPSRFVRDRAGAHIELDGTPVDDIVRLLVEFPSPLLRERTLVDTPGLGSVREAVSKRTIDFTSAAEMAPADAVVYLFRNWHEVDNEFLLGFYDRVGVEVPPVNAVAVLSRADEVGGGDRDALDEAARLASSLLNDPTLRALVTNVLPVAGLLAQSAVTLTEDMYRSLAAIAWLDSMDVAAALLSVDRFTAPDRLTAIAAEQRQSLLSALGMFGVRRAVDAIRSGRVTSAQGLSAELLNASGLAALHTAIFQQFAARAPVARAANALDTLEMLIDRGAVGAPDELLSELERIRINAHAIVELRSLNEVLCSPTLGIGPVQRSDLARVLGAEGTDGRTRVQLPPDASDAELAERLRSESARWQARALSSASLPDEQRLARVAVRSLTSLLAPLAAPPSVGVT
jgi:hypothetical protein